jgi:glucokinase
MSAGNDEAVLVLDIGGSKLALALATRDGTLTHQVKTPTASIKAGADLVGWVEAQVEGWSLRPRAMGISTGGPIDDVVGMVTRMPRMEMLWDFPLAEALRRAIPSLQNVRMVNDACAACAGVVMYGDGVGLRNVLYLTISTGIGGGAFIGGKLLRGHRGNVAEFGHMTVAPDGPRCDCGNQGCLEAVASASGLFHQFVAAGLLPHKDRGWADLGPWLKDRLEARDGQVLLFWHKALAGLAVGLTNLWNCYVPQAIVVGGGLSRLVLASRDELMELIEKRAQLMPMPAGVLRFSEIPDTIPLLGAAAVGAGWVPQEE